MSGNDESRGVRSRLRELGSYLLELSEEDTSFSAGATDGWIFSSVERKDVDDLPRLLWLALHEYEERTRRRSFFSAEIFGEPAWDILLDLFVAKVRGLRISVTSACIASQVPPTTALRWLTVLEDHGLIAREPDLLDGRRAWVQLTECGFKAMSGLLRDRRKRVSQFDFQATIRDS